MPRVLLVVLVVIALLCAMALGAGAYRGESPRDRDPPDMRGSGPLSWIDRIGLRSPIDSFRLSGACAREAGAISVGAGAVCTIRVPPTEKWGVRTAMLSPDQGESHLCLALSEAQFKDTCQDDTVSGRKYESERPTRLTVPKDGAWVKVWCAPLATAGCRLSVR